MAGYIFSLDNLDALRLYTRDGVYATKLSTPNGHWKGHHEGTFADYVTMHEGDNVYFFIKRKIYGIGKLLRIGPDCMYFNYPEAATPQPFTYSEIKDRLLWDEGEFSVDQRCICLFEPDPHFFTRGVDMDDVLASNPGAFKMLRAFWKVSFIKFDDDENQAFRNIILKRNQDALRQSDANDSGRFPFSPCHQKITERVTNAHRLAAGLSDVLFACAKNTCLKHEMAIEAGILHQLATGDNHTCDVFGKWDYLSHQVIASPFKPIDYMDRMDIFGYKYLSGYKPTKARFLVAEIKKDTARNEDIDQLLKYVDWARDEYCFGDYDMIKAFLIAHTFCEDIISHCRNVGVRKYTTGVKPATSNEWNDISLIAYSFEENARQLRFS